MPHGGGHHGGGHHGGGGWSGGGGHHHHHHHSYNYGGTSGGVYFIGGGGGWAPYRRRRVVHGWIWVGVAITICVVIILSVTLSVRFGSNGDDEKTYTPGDTWIKSFSTFFCGSMKVKVPSLPSDSVGSVYYLRETPPLTSTHQVQINNSFNIGQESYEYWNFYLHPKSTITYSGCVSDGSLGSSYDFYIIKGTSKFNSWKDDPSTSKAVAHTYVSQSCDSQKKSNQLTYTIPAGKNDHYYLVYDNSGYLNVRGSQTVSMVRYEYEAPKTNFISNCSLMANGPCHVLADFQSSHNKLLVMLPFPSNIDWDSTKYRVDISCDPQAIGYVIVTVVPFTAVVLVVLAIVFTCYFMHKKKKSTYRPIINRTPTTTETDVIIEQKPPAYSEQPPPYNPNYK